MATRDVGLGTLLSVLFVVVAAARASPTETRPSSLPAPAIEDQETREILERPTLRRQFPRIRFVGDRRTYEFLVDHPPLATQLARRVHPPLQRYTVTQVGNGVYTIEDRGALRGEAKLVKAMADQRVYWFKGEFRSLANLLRFAGRMVLVLHYREVREEGRTYVESDPEFYLRIDHLFFGFMVKLLTPLINVLIDRRVTTIAEATGKLFEQVVSDPDALYKQMASWNEVRPEDLEAYRRALLLRRRSGGP